MDSCDVEEGSGAEQHGGARAGEGVQVALQVQDKDVFDFEFYSFFQQGLLYFRVVSNTAR